MSAPLSDVQEVTVVTVAPEGRSVLAPVTGHIHEVSLPRESGGAFWLRGGAVGQEGGEGVGSRGAVSSSGEQPGANQLFINISGGGEGAAAGDARLLPGCLEEGGGGVREGGGILPLLGCQGEDWSGCREGRGARPLPGGQEDDRAGATEGGGAVTPPGCR